MKKPLFTGTWGNCHIQGIAVDKRNGYIYSGQRGDIKRNRSTYKAVKKSKIIGNM